MELECGRAVAVAARDALAAGLLEEDPLDAPPPVRDPLL